MTNEGQKDDRYERTFVLSVTKDRAWQCFTDPRDRSAWLAAPDAGMDDHYTTAGGQSGFSVVVNEARPLECLRWTEHHQDPAGTIEICVVFQDHATGSRITITQSRFGSVADDDWFASHRGWDEAISDLAFYLRTGVRARRHFATRGATGARYREAIEGVEVTMVYPDGFGAQAGLQPGDLLLDLAGAPIFRMADVWTLLREHATGERVTVRYVRGEKLLMGEAALSSAEDFPA